MKSGLEISNLRSRIIKIYFAGMKILHQDDESQKIRGGQTAGISTAQNEESGEVFLYARHQQSLHFATKLNHIVSISYQFLVILQYLE